MNFSTLLRPHERARRELDAYVDGQLAADQSARFEAHLEKCAQCVRELDAARSLKAAIRGMPERDAPRSFLLTPAMTGAAAPQWVAPIRGRRGRSLPPMRFAAGAAAVALAFVAAVDVWPGQRQESDSTRAAPTIPLEGAQGSPLAAAAATPPPAPKAAASPAAAPRPLSTPAGGGASASSADRALPAAASAGGTSNENAGPPATAAAANDAPLGDSSDRAGPGGNAFTATGDTRTGGDDSFPAIRLVEFGLVAFLMADAGLMVVRRRRRRSR